jgi:hypothetical protein
MGDSSLFERADMIEGGRAAAREKLERNDSRWRDA